jgi:hypothetical protein
VKFLAFKLFKRFKPFKPLERSVAVEPSEAIEQIEPISSACTDFDMRLQRLIGSRYLPHEAMDQLIRRHALSQSFIG